MRKYHGEIKYMGELYVCNMFFSIKSMLRDIHVKNLNRIILYIFFFGVAREHFFAASLSVAARL